MKFSQHLWQQNLPTYHKIIDLPFNSELARGSLDQSRFLFYMEQDAYYLVSFARALALIAARADSSRVINHFLNFAIGALVAERELHAQFLPDLYNADNIEPSPACLAYTRHLIATAATAPLEEALAAVLPCFWIYREVGLHIASQARENNPYILWIDTYSSQEFAEVTDQAIALLDEMASSCSAKVLDRMERAFAYSCLFECHFWDDAYERILFRATVFQKVNNCSIK